MSPHAALLRHRDAIGEGGLVVEVAFTDVSLSLGDAADPEDREAALDQVAVATGATPALMRQVHGAVVREVGGVPSGSQLPECDALVTKESGVVLLARAADCVPVLLADPATGWIAAVHCGRPGLQLGIVPATIDAMREAGAAPAVAWIGPHVCGSCYEVPEAMRDEVSSVVPGARATTSWGTPAVDLGLGVRSQLARAGVHDVREVGECTREDHTWPSYRRDGAGATRFAGIVWSHR